MLMKKTFEFINNATIFLRDTQDKKFIDWQKSKI
jgi:hypothetical protein